MSKTTQQTQAVRKILESKSQVTYKYIEHLDTLGNYYGNWFVIKDGVMEQCPEPKLEELVCLGSESLYVTKPNTSERIK